ncbi:MAG: hypothetical protein L6Q37_16420, partial [Bdellovibrionaceae bacterium]|nr:hypothetical protein [Pseudobdellovibrionaceae bacterium]
IRNFFHEGESEHFNFEFFNELNSASRRFGYLATADLGVEWQYFLSSYLSTGVGVVNGEENRKEEDGNQKDAYFLLDFNDDFFRVAFLYLRGGYDEYEKPFNLKERLILKAGYSFDFFKLGMEVFSSQDPAIGISDYKRAEGWDSTQFPETIVNARGGSLWTIISFSDRHSLMLKADYLDPYTEQKQDEINSQQVVFSYGSHSLNRFLVGYSKTSYQENHSKYSPEVEFGFAGLRRSF